MKNKPFCKVFDLAENQVLVMMQYDQNDEMFKMLQITQIEGAELSMGLGFKTQEEMEKCFNGYTETNAQLFLSTVDEMINT